MTLLVLLLFIVCFIALSWRRFEWAALLTVFSLPLYTVRFSLGVPTTLLEIMILLLFAVWFLKNRQALFKRVPANLERLKEKKPLLNQYPWRGQIIFWLLVSYLAVGVASWSWPALGLWRAYFLEPILLFIVIVNTFKNKESLIRLLTILGLSGALTALLAVYQFMVGGLETYTLKDFFVRQHELRAVSLFAYPNAVGLYAGPLAVILFGLFLYWLKVKKHCYAILSLLAVLVSILGIMAARSEGALLASLVCLLIILFFAGKKFRIVATIITIALVVVITSIPALSSYTKDRLLLRDVSGQIRRAQWSETVEMMQDKTHRVLLGVGLGNYQKALEPYHIDGIFVKDYSDPDYQRKVLFNEEYHKQAWQPLEIYLYPHNVILNFWTELGFLGVLAFIWLLVAYFKEGYLSTKKYLKEKKAFAMITLALTLAMATSMIHGLVDVPYFKNDLSALFWILMAIMAVVKIRREKKIN